MKWQYIVILSVVGAISLFMIHQSSIIQNEQYSFIPIPPKAIKSIIISNQGVTYNIKVSQQHYLIDGRSGNQERISHYLKIFYGEATLNLISMNPSKNEQYGVEDNNKNWIEFNGKHKIIVGNNAHQSVGCYIRRSNDSNIYKIDRWPYELTPAKKALSTPKQ